MTGAIRGFFLLLVAIVAGVATFFTTGAVIGAVTGATAGLGLFELDPASISSISLGLSLVAAAIVSGKVVSS